MFAAVGLITATGAFTTVEAERTADVEVAGDQQALLAIDASDNAGQYVDTSGDETTIDIGTTEQGAEGVNPNALTSFGPVLNVTNQGTQEVGLYVELSGTDADVAALNWTNGDSAVGESDARSLNPGEAEDLQFEIDLRDGGFSDDDDLDLTITIVADEDAIPE